MYGLLTECEWRKQAKRQTAKQQEWVGAQCVIAPLRKGLRYDRAFHLFLLILSFTVAVLLPSLFPRVENTDIMDLPVFNPSAAAEPRRVSSIRYELPEITYHEQTFTREQLMRGRMMLLNAQHPLPADAPPPNTFSIASKGRGMVSVQSLRLQSGQNTIHALEELFQALRLQGVSDVTVTKATQSRAQMQNDLRFTMRRRMKTASPDEARISANESLACMAQEELLQEYTVELRFQSGKTVDDRPLESTENGQKLLQTAWRYGFVRTHPDTDANSAYLFRHVGNAHATAMTYLNLSLPSYLEWLHRKGALAIYEQNALRYLILCVPMTGTHTVITLPVEASCEVSADNLGYAIAACTF